MSQFEVARSKSLAQLLRRKPDGTGQVDQFLLGYIFVEATLREVLRAYRSAQPHGNVEEKKGYPIRKDVVAKSVTHFGIQIPNQSIELLLDSRANKRGKKSARNLRNALVHEWNKEDADEVENRATELNGLIASCLKEIAALVLPEHATTLAPNEL